MAFLGSPASKVWLRTALLDEHQRPRRTGNGQPPSTAKSCFSPGGAQCPVSRHPGRLLRFPVAVCGELRLSV